MAFPVIITDGENTLTLNAGKLPVDVDFTGVTVNATFPSTVNVSITGDNDVTGNVAVTNNLTVNSVTETVNTAVTNNITVNDVIETVNVSVVSIGDSIIVDSIGSTVNVAVTGTPNVHVTNTANVAVTGTPNVHITNTPDVTGNVVVSNTVNVAQTGTMNVDVTAFSDTLTINDVISTVNVAVTGTPNVHVTNTPNVAVTSAPTVNVTVLNNEDIHPDNDSGIYDAFGRTRMSQPVTVFESKLVSGNGSNLWDILETGTANGSSWAWSQNTAAIVMTLNASVNTTLTRQSFERFAYQPGKSQQVMLSFVPGTAVTGITKTVGYGDNQDGLFFQVVNGEFGVCRRTTVNGTTVDNYVAQADWNIDTLNGVGASGYTINLTKAQILHIDFEWLGVGRARMGFVIDGKIIYCHAFNNANNLSTVYMRSPVLPIHFQISGNGAQAAGSTLTAMCAAVQSESGGQPSGRPRTASTGNAAIVASANWIVLKAIQLDPLKKSRSVRNLSLDLLNTDTNATAEYRLFINPTIAGGTLTYSTPTGSLIQEATGNGTPYVSAGTALNGGYISGRTSMALALESEVSLGFDIAGTTRPLVLCARAISGTPDMFAAFNWLEM